MTSSDPLFEARTTRSEPTLARSSPGCLVADTLASTRKHAVPPKAAVPAIESRFFWLSSSIAPGYQDRTEKALASSMRRVYAPIVVAATGLVRRS